MRIIKSSRFDQYKLNKNVIAIGSFDGIHKGHQRILKINLEIAKQKKIKSGILTFEPHPQEIVNNEQSHYYLTSRGQKIKKIKQLGLDYYFEMNFDHKIAKTPFDQFVEKIIVNNLNTKHIVVGTDFRLGYQGDGDIYKLKELGKKFNFEVTAVEPIMLGEHKISSSIIRELIIKGELDQVQKHLGHNYIMEGKVVKGFGRGKKLGIPTANIKPITKYVLPPDGVYAVYIHIDDQKYKGVANFGHKPTFDDNNFTIEVHIPEFNSEIYGEDIDLELIEYIREEKKFKNTDQLVKTIKSDILYIKDLL
ncbi:MAG: bifunctional riboflavin kinase/FAD synthetase [Halanaerobiales bacterium]|nr:bifunctional riboflavin kinase/FAD synthetase [Halanaerobiales bacterium]